MMQGRKEMSSAEQLVELRKARDRYKALADRFREEGGVFVGHFDNEGGPLVVMQEKLKHERDALRIANAYEKSIANIEARSSLMRQAQTAGPALRSVGARPAVLAFFLIVTAMGTLIIAYPRLYRQTLASLSEVQEYFVPVQPIVTLDSVAPPPPPKLAAAKVKSHRATAPRAIAPVVPAKKRLVRKAPKVARMPDAPSEGDFVAKVLQPDGTLKEQRFTARPRR